MYKRILLVDDESSLRRSLTLGLSQRGYETEPCEDGISALKKLELLSKNNQFPSAIVVDIKLPDIEGVKLAKIIKFKYPGIPIILITGYADLLNPQEIKDLKIQALLEKPFSADELAEQFQNFILKQPARKEQEAKSTSFYLLLKLVDEEEKFFDTYEKLYYKDKVLYCDAVKGEYDIILLAQGKTLREINEFKENLKKMDSVLEVESLTVENPVFDEDTNTILNSAEDILFNDDTRISNPRDLSRRVCSYVAIEIEKEKLDHIYPTIRLNENVVSCDYTLGSYNLILLVQGTYFQEIDRVIKEKIVPLNGVLKVKEFPIISLYEM